LESYGKETGFTVPDGYYDDLYQKMMGKVVVEKQKSHHRRQILRFSMVSGAAAAVALFITINIVFKNDDLQTFTQPEKMFSQVEMNSQPVLTDVTQTAEIETEHAPIIEEKKNFEVNINNTKTNNISKSSGKNEHFTDETTVLSIVEFYEDDARSDEFQETLMDLECYYDF
ncbi:MAG TPA: hypothetical protein PLI77_03660, partial [Bacteroidales bacterium]|nr:hypothetical protein [Bacteroidales bacterium]